MRQAIQHDRHPRKLWPLRRAWLPTPGLTRWTKARRPLTSISRRVRCLISSERSFSEFLLLGTQSCGARLGARTASLRQILAELDQDHDGRADCDYHRADKRQLFQQADKDRSDAESSLHMREAPACFIHRKSPFGPQQQRSDFRRGTRPGYGQFGCSIDQGEGTL